ncbi:MAG: TetR/AcrR family transcriptional regulator [Chloroflexota bacterium]|nr:TetR/AcrR family transcriptional regulator [Chloroflexota bacterium]
MARTPKVVEDRREQILAAAIHVFAQKGFTRATNKDIAREAGITPGLIYHYFESKEAVFKAIIETRSPIGMLHTLPPEILEQPPSVFLPFALQRTLEILESDDFVRLIRVFLPEIIHSPDLSPLGASVLQQALGFLSDYLRSHMESGQLRQGDAILSAQVLLGSIMGFVLRRQLLRDPVALQLTQEQIVTAIVDSVLNGLLPR